MATAIGLAQGVPYIRDGAGYNPLGGYNLLLVGGEDYFVTETGDFLIWS